MTITNASAAEWLFEVQNETEETITSTEPVVINKESDLDWDVASEPLTDDQVWGEPDFHADDPDEDAE